MLQKLYSIGNKKDNHGITMYQNMALYRGIREGSIKTKHSADVTK